MNGRLRLAFSSDVSDRVRRRIAYAFSVFCACFGYRQAEPGPCVLYDHSCRGYRLRASTIALGSPRVWQDPELGAMPLFHPCPDGRPDWLGEVFEWLSGQDELAHRERDGVGRLPFAASIQSRFGLDPAVPWATLAMHGFNRQIRDLMGRHWNPRPLSPWGTRTGFALHASHDVDVLPRGPWAVWRWVKNVVQAGMAHGPSSAAVLTRNGLKRLLWDRALFPGPLAVAHTERTMGARADYNLLTARAHRRDGDYRSTRARTVARALRASGADVGCHGSYRSSGGPGRLACEYSRLRRSGVSIEGGRQHWLRGLPLLVQREAVVAGAQFEGSLGWSERPGFRRGACMPFPVYDVLSDRPLPLVAIPLVVMDVTLGRRGSPARDEASAIVAAARRWGWGGVGILWHDPVLHGLQERGELGPLYWELLERNTTVTGQEVASALRRRYDPAQIEQMEAHGS